jgi:hypothetical protein
LEVLLQDQFPNEKTCHLLLQVLIKFFKKDKIPTKYKEILKLLKNLMGICNNNNTDE